MCPKTLDGPGCWIAEVTDYMSPPRALEVALHSEMRGRDFYAHGGERRIGPQGSRAGE